jgi:hypothetical protein
VKNEVPWNSENLWLCWLFCFLLFAVVLRFAASLYCLFSKFAVGVAWIHFSSSHLTSFLMWFVFSFYCMIFLVLVLVISLVSASVSPDSLSALQDLHTATNGGQWLYPAGDIVWNFDQSSADPCSENWSGILCDQTADLCSTSLCEITEISLSNYGLSGQLPPSLVQLTSLNMFKVEKNSLFGSIPWEYFYSLTSLSYLFLNENDFQGSIPADINRLAHVNLLKLRENNLVGTIPDAFGEISNLGNVALHMGI